jgi:hypothetical protein
MGREARDEIGTTSQDISRLASPPILLGSGSEPQILCDNALLGDPAEAEANDRVAVFRDPEPGGILRQAEFRKGGRRWRQPGLPAMADTQRVSRLLNDALGFRQIFRLRRAIGNVY